MTKGIIKTKRWQVNYNAMIKAIFYKINLEEEFVEKFGQGL